MNDQKSGNYSAIEEIGGGVVWRLRCNTTPPPFQLQGSLSSYEIRMNQE